MTHQTSAITVCLDFDGVCNTYRGWLGEECLFEPAPGLVEFLRFLQARGDVVAICSTRNPARIEEWLRAYGLRDLVGIVSRTKPVAHVYVDDNGFRFNGDFGMVRAFLEAGKPKAWWMEAPPPCR